MLEALDGPSKPGVKLADDITPQEVKAGASAFEDRKIVTLQGDAKFYVYFAEEGEGTPTAGNVSTKGFMQFKDAKESYEAGSKQAVWIMAISGSVNVRFAERG